MEESISVALCTYNGEEFLPKQLESIKQQSIAVHELVVCDDGSRDATLTILEKFKQSVTFPVHIHQNTTNLGSSKNFEQCLQKCTGEFIFLCDQDDVWMPNKVEKMLEYFRIHTAQEAVFSNAQIIDQRGLQTGNTSFKQIEFNQEAQSNWLAGGSFEILLKGYVVTGATMAIRKRCLPELIPVPNIIPELIHDGWMALKLAIHNQIGFIDEPLIQYREHESQQVGLKAKNERVSLIDRFTRSRNDKLCRIRKKHEDAQALYQYISSLPHIPKEVIQQLEKRHDFYSMRANLPTSRLLRIFPITPYVISGSYKKLEGGKWWRPILGDLFE
jgi:glycosyltransferase involved in cell wall biosynthesis